MEQLNILFLIAVFICYRICLCCFFIIMNRKISLLLCILIMINYNSSILSMRIKIIKLNLFKYRRQDLDHATFWWRWVRVKIESYVMYIVFIAPGISTVFRKPGTMELYIQCNLTVSTGIQLMNKVCVKPFIESLNSLNVKF